MDMEGASGTALPTVAAVPALPELHYGLAEVVAARNHLARRVRWVHVSELAGIAGLLGGGELILTTGIALPVDEAALRGYADDLAAVRQEWCQPLAGPGVQHRPDLAQRRHHVLAIHRWARFSLPCHGFRSQRPAQRLAGVIAMPAGQRTQLGQDPSFILFGRGAVPDRGRLGHGLALTHRQSHSSR